MLRIILVASSTDIVPAIDLGSIVIRVEPGAEALNAIVKHKPDMVMLSTEVAILLNEAIVPQKKQARTNVMASTHHGIQLVPIKDVYYFQAEHKYVITYHSQGQLLIDDSLDKLEEDFSKDFIRIHRKTLVAAACIEKLIRKDSGQHYVKLRNSDIELQISRRQLSTVRKLLLCM